MPLVSIIVPTRLRNHLLPRSVESLLRQTHRQIEILIVDDNPPDQKLTRDASLAKLLMAPQIRVLENESPRNAARARNLGVRAAQGDWVTYLDDDDAYQPDKIERQLAAASQSGLPMGLCGVTYHLPHRTRRSVPRYAFLHRDAFLFGFHAMPALIHRNTFGKIHFREDLDAGEDAYYFYALVRHFNVDKVFNVADALVDVFPQPNLRVNLNAEAVWKAAVAIHRDFGASYPPKAAEAFYTRTRLGYLKQRKGKLGQMLVLATKLLLLRGPAEFRFLANCFLFKIPWLRQRLVS